MRLLGAERQGHHTYVSNNIMLSLFQHKGAKPVSLLTPTSYTINIFSYKHEVILWCLLINLILHFSFNGNSFKERN